MRGGSAPTPDAGCLLCNLDDDGAAQPDDDDLALLCTHHAMMLGAWIATHRDTDA